MSGATEPHAGLLTLAIQSFTGTVTLSAPPGTWAYVQNGGRRGLGLCVHNHCNDY